MMTGIDNGRRGPQLGLEYRQVDVFSRFGLGGSGLMVVLDSDKMTTHIQEELAREVRQFGTVFVSQADLVGRAVAVCTRAADGWIDASMDQGPVQLGRLVVGELADRCRRALSLPATALDPGLPMQVVSTGLSYLLVPVRSDGFATARIDDPPSKLC